VIQLLGIFPKEPKSGYNRDTCTPKFIAALFIQPSYGNSPDALQLMNESVVVVHKQNGVLLSHKK
jgi:hypothetical protein